MKLLLTLSLILFFALPGWAENKTRPTTFVGVPWGATPDTALRILGARAGITAPETPPAGDKVELTGGNFAGQPATKWTLEFANGKFVAASVLVNPHGTASGLYRELKQMLIGKYGPVSGERKPGGNGDDKKERLQRRRSGIDEKTFGTVAYWKFAPTLSDKERKTIEIELAGPDGNETTTEALLVVTIRYINDSMKPTHVDSTPSTERPGPPVKAIKADDL